MTWLSALDGVQWTTWSWQGPLTTTLFHVRLLFGWLGNRGLGNSFSVRSPWLPTSDGQNSCGGTPPHPSSTMGEEKRLKSDPPSNEKIRSLEGCSICPRCLLQTLRPKIGAVWPAAGKLWSVVAGMARAPQGSTETGQPPPSSIVRTGYLLSRSSLSTLWKPSSHLE